MAGFFFRTPIRFFVTAGLHPHAGGDAPVGFLSVALGPEAFAE